MKKLTRSITIVGCAGLAWLSGCKLADLRTESVTGESKDREAKAIALLNKAIDVHNLRLLARANTYSFRACDDWKGMLAMMNPFPEDEEWMEMRFKPKTFDGQFYYLNNKTGTVQGTQSFHYYTIDESGKVTFKDKKSRVFGLTAVQYLFELPLRLINAPLLKYAGTREFEETTYELVFATWQSVAPNPHYDQYLLYINAKTHELAFASYTIRGMYLPAPDNMYGSIRYEDIVENEDGIRYASTLYIQINGLKPKDRWAHKMTVQDLTLNDFDSSVLYPSQKLEALGDRKNSR